MDDKLAVCTILPIDLRHHMLTAQPYNSTGYIGPASGSQVLLRVGGEWSRNPRDPIPTPTRRAAKTPLRAFKLANRVSAKGNRIEALNTIHPPKVTPS
jgi:hypothetical protein